MSPTLGRLIPLHARRGAENMAADQALLESVDATGQPVLRFYTWRRATLSLGYFQRLSERGEHAESQSLDCVRRATGGGAIVHHHELTYSISIPRDASSTGPRLDLYRATHRALAEALLEFGVRVAAFRELADTTTPPRSSPFLCFQRRTDEDLIVGGYKVVGSAQRKSRTAVLQHGSVLLRSSPYAPQLPGIAELTSRSIPLQELAATFTQRVGRALTISWEPGGWTEQEMQRTAAVVEDKFGSDRWLRRR